MGFLDNIKGFFGTQPGAIQAGAATPTGGSAGFLGNLQQAPVQGPPTSFLDRLQTGMNKEDARGRTFGDKLFAAGQIAQGQDPSQFLGNREAMSNQERAEAEGKDRQAKLSQLMAASMGPDGNINPQTLMQGAAGIGGGIDIDTMLKLQKANEPQYSSVNIGGGAGAFNQRTGQISNVIAGQKPAPPGYRWNAAGDDLEMLPGYMTGQTGLAGGKAKAVAPFRPKPQGRAGYGSYIPPGATPGLPQ